MTRPSMRSSPRSSGQTDTSALNWLLRPGVLGGGEGEMLFLDRKLQEKKGFEKGEKTKSKIIPTKEATLSWSRSFTEGSFSSSALETWGRRIANASPILPLPAASWWTENGTMTPLPSTSFFMGFPPTKKTVAFSVTKCL